jgi:hypothetical protein
LGGRQWRGTNADQVRQAKEVCKRFNNGSDAAWEKYNGDIWDHIFAEFEYANGARCLSFSGHSPGSSRVSEKIVGTKGTSNCVGNIGGENAWSFEGKSIDPYVQEHIDLIASIREGKPLNEGQQVAESTLTAIGARIAAYTGQVINWDWLMNESKYSLVPSQEELMSGKPVYQPISTGADPMV